MDNNTNEIDKELLDNKEVIIISISKVYDNNVTRSK